MLVNHHLFEFLGVTIIGVPPIGVVHFEFSEMPSVLYGRNGAGKTRLLRAIEAAFTGFRPAEGQIFLHVTARHESEFDDIRLPMRDHLLSVRSQVDEFRMYELQEDPVSREHDYSWDVGSLLIEHVEARLERHQEEIGLRVLLESYANLSDHDRVPLVLVPTGTTTPAWDLDAGGDMREGSIFRSDLFIRMQLEARKRTGLESHPSYPGLFASELRWDDEERVDAHELVDLVGPSVVLSETFAWPEWASLPVMKVATDAGPIFGGVVGMISEEDWPAINEITMDHVRKIDYEMVRGELHKVSPDRFIVALDDDEVVYDQDALEKIDAIERRAAELLFDVLPLAPAPMFRLGSPTEWLDGRLPQWITKTRDQEVDLESLSWAERMWAVTAISIAVHEKAGRYVVLLLDEPERGLHRSSEAQLPDVLHALSRSGLAVIVASHSPALLNDPRLAVRHVRRDVINLRSQLSSEIPSASTDSDRALLIESLGITPADLYQMTRVFVCVEGEHDRAALETLLSETLSTSFARCLPMGGAKNLKHALAVRMLFEFTDARVVVVLDNSSQAVKHWNNFRNAHLVGDERAANAAIGRLRKLDSGEARWLYEFAEEVRRTDLIGRVIVVGLSEPDVVCYLPLEQFLTSGSEDWSDVLTAWNQSTLGGRPTDLKGWLKANRGASFSVRRIEKAAESAVDDGRSLHQDLVRLSLVIQEASSRF